MRVTTLYVTILTIMLSMTISSHQSYAQTDNTLNKIEGDKIKDDPISKKILKNIEIAKKQIVDINESAKQKKEQQKIINEKRKLSQTNLNLELEKIGKKYEEFTPVNAFKKFVLGVNATHQEIYWDQFHYLNTKITLAKDARDIVLKNGGTYREAMTEYNKYAKMSRVEMVSVIKNLNIKHNFADKDIQTNFDADAKLPRFEDDLKAPCYGCKSNISNVKLDTAKTKIVTVEKPVESLKTNQMKILKEKLTNIQKEFLGSTDRAKQKMMVQEMNNVIKQIQDLSKS
jgi:hypothetical protein